MKDAGYYTAAAGKWHLGEAVRDQFDKIYDVSTAGFVLPTGAEGKKPKMIAKKQPSGCEDWEAALDERPKDRPFFMWLAALDPHRAYEQGALNPPHKDSEVIVPAHLPDTSDVRKDLRMHYDEIGRLDQYVGKVLGKLEQQGVADDTIVLFISDNGRPFPRDKTTLYDGGIRTPWLIRWPATIAAGAVTESLVSSVDIAPTFLQLAGSTSDSFESEGVSFAETLTDPTKANRQFAFAEDHCHDYEDQARAVVNQQYKLIRNDYEDLAATPSADARRALTWQNMLRLESESKLNAAQRACFIAPRPKWELFDLQRDPGETQNLADDLAYQSVRLTMVEALNNWAQNTGDFLPSRRTPDEFERVTGQPDHSVRVRPRKSKYETYRTNGKY